jgi:polyisoprenyl-phosphate glycosyltransferase
LSNLHISVIIPCFNEEAIIRETYTRIKNVLSLNQYYEMLFINDGSHDATFHILNKISEEDKRVKVLSLSRNFGHQAAVSAGIQYCTGDIAIIIDADLQDPPEIIPEMIKKYEEGNCNVVYGVREQRKGETFFKKITAKWFYKLINSLSETKMPLDAGDFRLIDRKVINEFRKLKEKNKYIRGIISWIGFKQVPIYYSRDSRIQGNSKYPLSKMVKFALTGLLYFTKKPLQLAISMGFISIVIGLGLIVYVVIAKLSNTIYTVQGWTSTMIVIIFFGGVQLLTVGVLGEYIGSIFDEVKNRPEYIIDEKINFKEKE